jgi:hypothetical protein
MKTNVPLPEHPDDDVESFVDHIHVHVSLPSAPQGAWARLVLRYYLSLLHEDHKKKHPSKVHLKQIPKERAALKHQLH